MKTSPFQSNMCLGENPAFVTASVYAKDHTFSACCLINILLSTGSVQNVTKFKKIPLHTYREDLVPGITKSLLYIYSGKVH